MSFFKSLMSAGEGLANAVVASANGVTKVVTIGTSALTAVDVVVQDSLDNQRANSLIAKELFLDQLYDESRRTEGKRRAELKKDLDADPVFAKHFAEAGTKLSPIIEQLRAERAIKSGLIASTEEK